MTREELIQAIYNSDICPKYSCDRPEEEGHTGECCKKCAEKQLEEYEKQIYNKGYNDGVARQRLNCDDCFYKLSLESEEYEKQIKDAVIDDCIKALDCMQTPSVLGITYEDGISNSMIRLEQLKGE